MPVFDFSDTPKKEEEPQCTYTVYYSNEPAASPEKPMLVLDNSSRAWRHHSCGVFTNQAKRTAFEFKEEDGTVSADILQVDARFTSLLRWLGENHISVRLSGQNRGDGYAVYKIREVAFGGGTKLSAEDGFLQFMIERLLAGSAPERGACFSLCLPLCPPGAAPSVPDYMADRFSPLYVQLAPVCDLPL